jgi:hypothetical protein
MLSILVLGPGCANCELLERLASQAIDDIQKEHPDLEATVEKISDPEVFLEYGFLSTPGLVVNGKLISSGRVPPVSQITQWLREIVESSK